MLIVPENIQTPASITIQFLAPYFAADLSTVSEVRLNVTRRDGTADVWTMAIDSATPGQLLAHYTFQTGDISGVGLYYLAPVLDVPGGNVPADTLAMFVTNNNRLSPRLEVDAWIVATSAVETAGPVKREWVIIDNSNSPYPALLTSPYIAVDLSAGPVSIVLPEGNDGDTFIFSDFLNAAGINALTLTGSGGQLVPTLTGSFVPSHSYSTDGLTLWIKLGGGAWIPENITGDSENAISLQGFAISPVTPSDGEVLTWDDGVDMWLPAAPPAPPPADQFLFRVTAPPAASNWVLRQTASNATLFDVDSVVSGIHLSATNRIAATDVIIADLPVTPPGPSNAAIGGFLPSLSRADFSVTGLAFYETSSTKFVAFNVFGQSDGQVRMQLVSATGLTGVQTSLVDVSAYVLRNPLFFRLRDDGIYLFFDYSSDSVFWTTIGFEPRGAHFTVAPDRVGIDVDPRTPSGLTLVHWGQT